MTYARDDKVKELAQAFGRDIGEVKPNVRKNAFTANRAPLPSDDEGQGFAAGSLWQWQGMEWLRTATGWLPKFEITPELFGAPRNGGDDAPAFRAAIAFLAAQGGGVLHLRDGAYNLRSLVSMTAWMSTSANPGTLVQQTVQCPIFLPAGVSIKGPGRTQCTLDASSIASGMTSGIGTVDYSDGEISGFAIKGPGALVAGGHGMHVSFLSANAPHVNRNIRLGDLHIHDWPSYGIGHQYGSAVNFTVDGVLIEDTGADGIDWKIRFAPGDSQDVTAGVVMDRIVVRRPGQRITTSISGLGIRGRAILSNIEVTGIKAGCAGIEMEPGLGQGTEFRQPSTRSSLTNFYIEGNDPGQNVIGLNCFSAGPMVISNGYLRGCIVQTVPQTVSPTGFVDGPSISHVTVEGARGQDSFYIRAHRTQLFACRSLSDKEYFETARANLAPGQTTIPVTGGITGPVVVLKNGAVMASGYTVSGNSVVLDVPAISTDVFIVIQPTNRPFRIEGENCTVTGGGCDAHHATTSGMLAGTTVQNSTMITGFYDERLRGVQVIPEAASQVRAFSPNADEDLRLVPKGTGRVRFGTLEATTDTAITGYVTIRDAGGVLRKLAVIP